MSAESNKHPNGGGAGERGKTEKLKPLKTLTLDYESTHLKILSDKKIDGKRIRCLVESLYADLTSYISRDPFFQISYAPVKVSGNPPTIVRLMAEAAEKAGVGPMAAVAGAFSQLTGEFILEKCGAREVIVENGGDIFLKLNKARIIGVHAGPSIFSDKIGFEVNPRETPLGVCTSSASVGPSISLGDSDAVTVFAKSAALADAAATAVGNKVKGTGGIKKGIAQAKKIIGVRGVLIIRGGEMGVWGKLPKIVKVEFKPEITRILWNSSSFRRFPAEAQAQARSNQSCI